MDGHGGKIAATLTIERSDIAKRAVAAIDASIQFAPKNCREAMLLAREALTGERQSAVVVCRCGEKSPEGAEPDVWRAAHRCRP